MPLTLTVSRFDLAQDDLNGEWPEGFEAGLTEDSEDDNVVLSL